MLISEISGIVSWFDFTISINLIVSVFNRAIPIRNKTIDREEKFIICLDTRTVSRVFLFMPNNHSYLAKAITITGKIGTGNFPQKDKKTKKRKKNRSDVLDSSFPSFSEKLHGKLLLISVDYREFNTPIENSFSWKMVVRSTVQRLMLLNIRGHSISKACQKLWSRL